MRRLFFLIGLGMLAVAPALPDIVDVTVSGSVASSGSISAVCGLATPGCEAGGGGAPNLLTVPYSFSGTNTQLGTFSDSWVASNPITGSVDSYADENTELCIASPSMSCPPGVGDNLSIDLTGGHSGFAVAYSAEETENMSISFDLTEESLATLYGEVLLGTASNSGELLDSNGNIILQNPLPGGETSTLLQPGAYQLDASVSGGGSGGLSSPSVTDSELLLTAQFTPVPTPEPRGTVFAALLAIMLGGYVVSRRRRVS